jgi:integrase
VSRGGRRANGEGTIYQRSDGRFEGSAYVWTTAGVRVRRSVYGKTREEAHQRLTALLRQSHQGAPVAATSQTVGQYLEYWLEHVARHKVRPLTYRTYAIYVREHLIPGLGKRRLARLTAQDVRSFLAGRRETGSRSPGNRNRPLSARTLFHLHAVLRNALEHAVREDLIPRNVGKQVQMSPGHAQEIEPLSVAEARMLLKAASEDRLYGLYAVALSLGLRRGEALGLRWSDVDLDGDGVLRVRQTLQRVDGRLVFAPPKTRRSRRTIPLPAATAKVLREHRQRQDRERAAAGQLWQDLGLVFTTTVGTPIEPNDFSKAFGRLCRTAGLRPIRLHDLRHTCASTLLAQGVPPRVVMEVLGHSSLDVTMNIYGHVMLDAQREALSGMDTLFGQ